MESIKVVQEENKLLILGDFFGLRCLQEPDQRITSDIVLVHGLAGGSISTWRYSNGSFWPVWLSKSIRGSRIWSFGYNASEVYFESQNNTTGRFFNFAEDLCIALSDAPERFESKPPITFICHGVGGIIVKSALVYSHIKTQLYSHISRTTKHIIFLDTPHAGLDIDTWKAVHGSVATLQAHDQLKLWSAALGDLSASFGGIANSFAISSGYADLDQLTDDGHIRVVQQLSARLFFPNEERLAITNASHITLCKFGSENDHNYISIWQRINAVNKRSNSSELDANPEIQFKYIRQQLTTNDAKMDKLKLEQEALLANADQSKNERAHATKEKLKSKIKKWLSSKELNIDYALDVSNHSYVTPGTCLWIGDHEGYRSWKQSNRGIAWLHGIQGCGKSTMIAHLYQTYDHWKKVCFFCPSEAPTNAAVVISSLVHQMVVLDDLVSDKLIPVYEKTRLEKVSSNPTAQLVLETAVAAFGDCHIFIDALDNCLGRIELIKMLLKVTNRESRVKIVCSSREFYDIERALRQPDVFDIQVSPELIQADVELFIRDQMNQNLDLQEKLAGIPYQIEYISQTLAASANGMFLLVRYFIEDLALKRTIDEMNKFLDDLPRDVHPYYLKIFNEMDDRSWPFVKKIVAWVTWVKRPLSLVELKEAMSLDGSQYLDLSLDIKLTFGCLIKITNGVVKLSHDSVRRFIMESSLFRNSSVYTHIVPKFPQDDIAQICINFLNTPKPKISQEPTPALEFKNSNALHSAHPFLGYAAINWPYHWRDASNPYKDISAVHGLLSGSEWPLWVEALSQFQMFDQLNERLDVLHTFVLKLKMNPFGAEYSESLEIIAHKLSLLQRLGTYWRTALQEYPREVYNLALHLESPSRIIGQRNIRATKHPNPAINGKAYSLLDKVQLHRGFDRFLLTDLHVVMWRSLMPSIAWNNSYRPMTPQDPAKAIIRTHSIASGRGEDREGIDPAEVDGLTVSTVVRKDLRAVGIVWARFRIEKNVPLDIKTYAWFLREDPWNTRLWPLQWSDEIDPCRIDLTTTLAFGHSRRAIAFNEDMESIWTPGGLYNLGTGECQPAPLLFKDPNITCLTFAENCSIIAGINKGLQLGVYNIPEFQLITVALGDFTILDISPLGTYILFLQNCTQDKGSTAAWQIGLLCQSGSIIILFDENTVDTHHGISTDGATDSPVTIEYLKEFYNNGGLQVFSADESLLVISTPGSPDWILLAYELNTQNIPASKWRIEYTGLLAGAGILSLTLCPVHQRRLYILDSLSVLRRMHITRIQEMSLLSASRSARSQQPSVWTFVSNTGRPTITTATHDPEVDEYMQHFLPSLQSLLVSSYDINSLEQHARCGISLSYLRTLLVIKSQNLILDNSSTMQAMTTEQPVFANIAKQVQYEIDATCLGSIDVIQEEYGSPAKDSATESRVTTRVVLSQSCNIGFFHSLILIKIPDAEQSTNQWLATTIMDVRWLHTSKRRKTGDWYFANTGEISKQHLASAFDEVTHTLVYSVAIEWLGEGDSTLWRSSRLLLCHLSAQPYFSIEPDPRGTFVQSLAIRKEGFVLGLTIAEHARSVFVLLSDWPERIVEISLASESRGETLRELYDPFRRSSFSEAACFSWNGDELYAFALDGPVFRCTRIHLDPSNGTYAMCIAAYGPDSIDQSTNLSAVWTQTQGDQVTLIGHGTNYLRRDNLEGGNAIWPIMVSLKKDDFITTAVDIEMLPRESYFPASESGSSPGIDPAQIPLPGNDDLDLYEGTDRSDLNIQQKLVETLPLVSHTTSTSTNNETLNHQGNLDDTNRVDQVEISATINTETNQQLINKTTAMKQDFDEGNEAILKHKVNVFDKTTEDSDIQSRQERSAVMVQENQSPWMPWTIAIGLILVPAIAVLRYRKA